MADPTCYVISGDDWRELVQSLAFLALIFPVAWQLITADWWFWVDRFRVLARRRRLRVIREARRD